MLAPAEDARSLAVTGLTDARQLLTPLTASAASLVRAKAKAPRHPFAVCDRPPFTAASVVKVPLVLRARVAVSPTPALVLLEELVLLQLRCPRQARRPVDG